MHLAMKLSILCIRYNAMPGRAADKFRKYVAYAARTARPPALPAQIRSRRLSTTRIALSTTIIITPSTTIGSQAFS